MPNAGKLRILLVTAASAGVALLGPLGAGAEENPAARTEKSASSTGGGLGLGISIGHPTGLAVRASLSPAFAIAGGVGSGLIDGHGLHAHADLQFSPAALGDSANHRVPLYVGVGARFYDHRYDRVSRYEEGRDTHIGLRVPVGVAFESKTAPFDFFAEIAAVADFVQTGGCTVANATASICAHDQRLEVHLAVGGRYYFGR